MYESGVIAALPIASGQRVGAHLGRLLRGRRWRLSAILVLFLAEAAIALVFPIVVGALVDALIAGDGSGVPVVFWLHVAVLVAAALGAGILGWLGALALAHLAETMIAELREQYVEAALELPRSVIEEAGTGDIVTRASDDIAQVSSTLPRMLPRVAVSVFSIVLVAGGLGTLNPWYLIGFALTVPAYVLTARWYVRIAPGVYATERGAESVRGQEVLGTLTALPTVTAHRLERRQLARIRRATWETARWSVRARIVQNRLFGHLNITEAAGLLTVLGVGVWLAVTGRATAGEVTAAALLFLATIGPIESLLFVMDDLQSALAALGRLVGVIDAGAGGLNEAQRVARSAGSDVERRARGEAELRVARSAGGEAAVRVARRVGGAAAGGVALSARGEAAVSAGGAAAGGGARSARGEAADDVASDAASGRVVAVEGASFAYGSDAPTLHEIDVELRAGETVAIVGTTGAGKSTLAGLIAGVHSPTGGRIVRAVPHTTVMTLTQETHVFAGTLRQNLTLAAPAAADDEVLRVLEQVGAAHLVTTLPQGLDTLLGDGGHSVTVTQAQHLALARLLLSDPALVILDEATAEAGSADTSALDDAAAVVTKGRAALVIAHRLSQAAAADRIILLSEGRVAEAGTHADLLAARGPYATLWSAWSTNRPTP